MSAGAVIPRFTVITLGVSEMRRSIAFYASLGFVRKFRATGEEVAFFDTGGTVLALYPRSALAHDAGIPDTPRPQAFRGVTLAWNCRSEAEVGAALASAVEKGALLLKLAQRTDYLWRLQRLFCRSGRSCLGSGGGAGNRCRRR